MIFPYYERGCTRYFEANCYPFKMMLCDGIDGTFLVSLN